MSEVDSVSFMAGQKFLYEYVMDSCILSYVNLTPSGLFPTIIGMSSGELEYILLEAQGIESYQRNREVIDGDVRMIIMEVI